MREKDTNVSQLGYAIDSQGKLVIRDHHLIGLDKRGKPKYIEESDGVDKIWQTFQYFATEYNKNGDNRHIFLVGKGHRIEGMGEDRKYSGYLTSDALVIKNENSNNSLNFIHSFNENGSGILKITYRNKYGEPRSVSLSKTTNFFDYNSRIDLTNTKDVLQLRAKIKESKRKR